MIDAKQASELADLALRIARDAANLALRGYRHPKRVSRKGAIDLVTEYDTASEALIVARLREAMPGVPIVAEEGGGTSGADLTFYVDPIDGTTNYAHGHPFWCVSIGVLDGARQPVAGAIVAPSIDTWWQGSRGAPTVRNGEACRVSTTAALEDALLATGFPYDRKTSAMNNFDAFVEMKKRALGVRRCGSAAIDLAMVADGTYDGYWELKLKPWDVAAGACLVLGAGGRLSGVDGSAVDLPSGNVVATNGAIHDELVAVLEGTWGC